MLAWCGWSHYNTNYQTQKVPQIRDPEEVKVFFSFGEGDCWMSWGFFFLFPMCSPHWVPMGSSSSSQTVPHFSNVFIKVFPIAPQFYPICFTHFPDGSIGRNWALNKPHPRLTHMGGLEIPNYSPQVVHMILTRNDLKHPNSPISTWDNKKLMLIWKGFGVELSRW